VTSSSSPRAIVDLVPWLDKRLQRPTWLAPYLDVLERAPHGNLQVALSAPPQHGKTETTLAALVKYARDFPQLCHAYLTYNKERAESVSKKLRARLQRAGVRFTGTLSLIELDGGGQIIVSSLVAGVIGHPISGVCIVDDPYGGHSSSSSANSKLYREAVVLAMQGTVFTRMHPGASIVVMHTRWHVDDLIAWLTHKDREERFDYINIRAIAEDDDILGRAPGEALAPNAKRDIEFLLRKKRIIGEVEFAQQYQGRPRVRGAGVFRAANYYTVLPSKFSGAFGVDLAYTEDTRADFSGYLELWREENTNPKLKEFPTFYVVDLWRKQCEVPEFADNLKAAHDRRPTYPITWYCSGPERGAAQMIWRLYKLRINARTATRDKCAMSQEVAVAWNDGRVLVPDAVAFPHTRAWCTDFVHEVQDFTGNGKERDDQVDMLINAHAELRVDRSWSPVARTTTTQSRTW